MNKAINIMKNTQSVLSVTTLLIALLLSTSDPLKAAPSTLPPDTNPALLYWREFAVMPETDSATMSRLLSSQTITQKHIDFSKRYDEMFRRLSKVRKFDAPCNWGDDLDEGPFLLLPYLAQAKNVATIARIRARVHRTENKEEEAVNDILSLYTLSGHIASSPILINILVHFSMEKIGAAIVAENLAYFSDDSLKRIKTGMMAAPKAKNIADTVATEKQFMAGWLRNQLNTIETQSADRPSEAYKKAELLVRNMFEASESDAVWESFRNAGGTSVEALIDLLDRTDSDYRALEALCRQPTAAYLSQMEQFDQKSKESANPVRRWIFPTMTRSKTRELGKDIVTAMVETAIDSRLLGNSALSQSKSPVDGQSFRKSAFTMDGKTIGFVLESRSPSPSAQKHLFLLTPINGLILNGPKLGEEMK